MTEAEKYARVLDDALAINAGACNPQGVLRHLARMIPTVIEHHNSNTHAIGNDPALILVMAQLIFIMRRIDVSCHDGHEAAVRETEALLVAARSTPVRAAGAGPDVCPDRVAADGWVVRQEAGDGGA